MGLGIDLTPFHAGVDALVRMASALERLADVAEFALDEYRIKNGMKVKYR